MVGRYVGLVRVDHPNRGKREIDVKSNHVDDGQIFVIVSIGANELRKMSISSPCQIPWTPNRLTDCGLIHSDWPVDFDRRHSLSTTRARSGSGVDRSGATQKVRENVFNKSDFMSGLREREREKRKTHRCLAPSLPSCHSFSTHVSCV